MRKILNKDLITLMAVVVFTVAMNITAFAYGWGSDSNGSFYYSDKDNTTKYTNGWYWVPFDDYGNAYSYYFDENGYILKDTIQDGFDLNSDGIWVINGIAPTAHLDLPYDYYDVQASAQGLSNSLLGGTYYEYWEARNRLMNNSTAIVTVVDEDTIIIQGQYWGSPSGSPVEAKKVSENVYRYDDVPTMYYDSIDFVFRDNNILETYNTRYKWDSDSSEWTTFGGPIKSFSFRKTL